MPGHTGCGEGAVPTRLGAELRVWVERCPASGLICAVASSSVIPPRGRLRTHVRGLRALRRWPGKTGGKEEGLREGGREGGRRLSRTWLRTKLGEIPWPYEIWDRDL